MPEDPLRLREELAQLKKEIDNYNHIKETLQNHLEELSKDELKYIASIPIHKQQAKEYQAQAKEAQSKVAPIKQELDELNKELIVIRGLNSIQSKSLAELKETQKKIIEETKVINEQVKGRHEQLKQRELAVGDREKACELRETGYSNRDFELIKGEVELAQKQAVHAKKEKELQDNILLHQVKVEDHKNKVTSFIEQKEFHEQDRADLQNKLAQVDKLKKEQVGMKAQLLLQADKASKSIDESERKKKMLDKAIDDLKNQENNLKLKELRVQKLIKDAGISKELKELEESLK